MSSPAGEDTSIWAGLLDCDFRQRYVDCGGVRTRILESGSGPPLVLLHGTGGHAEAFIRNLASLSRDFHVIAYDMVGHGFSEKPDHPYTLDTYCDHLLAVLDALGIERAHLSGESLGGWVAAWFARHHPGRLDRLVLAVPGNVTSKPETMRKIRESTLDAVRNASSTTVRARLEWLFAPGNRWMVTDELVDLRLRIYTQPGATQAVEHVLALQDPTIRERYAWTQEWCSQIKAPTLIVWTSDDPTGTLDEGRLLEKWIGGSRLVSIDAAGHWPQWEQPQEFEALHREFLLAKGDA